MAVNSDNSFRSLNNLRTNKNVVVLPADKESWTVILSRDDYINKVNIMINEGRGNILRQVVQHTDLKWFQDFLCINFKDQIYYDNMCLVSNQPALYFITGKTHKSKAIEKISVDQLKLCPIIDQAGPYIYYTS